MFRMAKQEKGEKGENAKYKRDQGEWGIRSKLATGFRGECFQAELQRENNHCRATLAV